MADVLHGNAKLTGPEKRYGLESLTASEDIPRRHLPLTLGNDPMFNANKLAGIGVWPPRDVARSKDSRRTRFEVLVDHNAAIHFQSSLFGQRQRWANSHAQDKEIRIEGRASAEYRFLSITANYGLAHVA